MGQTPKHGFPDVVTLHYVTGMLVAEEENFAISYNIVSLTGAMRKALNRERTNVGRTAYSDRVKQMLLASKADAVAETLAEDLQKIEQGTNRDEVKWTDVAVHACQILNASKRVVFVTAGDLTMLCDAIDHAKTTDSRSSLYPRTAKKTLTCRRGMHLLTRSRRLGNVYLGRLWNIYPWDLRNWRNRLRWSPGPLWNGPDGGRLNILKVPDGRRLLRDAGAHKFGKMLS